MITNKQDSNTRGYKPATENAEQASRKAAYKETTKGDALALQGRNTPQVPQSAAPKPASRFEGPSAKDAVPQVGGTGSPTNIQGRRRPTNPANSKNRKRPRRKVYDPNLGSHPIPVVKEARLMEQVVSDENFIAAAKVMLKEPQKATGPDRKTVTEVCKPIISFAGAREGLRRELLKGTYRPGSVRTTYIPKANGKKRKLGIANVKDRLVQRMILQAVEANTPDQAWSRSSYAYSSGLGIPDAVRQAGRLIADGAQYAVCLDLKAFFDNVPHHRLLCKLSKHIADRRIVELVRRFLTPVVLDKGIAARNRIGAPQGSVISPWLTAKLYLDELDRELERRGHLFVRYADDVTIFCRSKVAAKRIRLRIVRFLEEVMKCPVNWEKTKVVSVDSLQILGLYRYGKGWRIQRKKERAACSTALSLLRQFAESGDTLYKEKAVSMFEGWLQHYRQIPDLDGKEVPALERWFSRQLVEKTNQAIDKGGLGQTPFD